MKKLSSILVALCIASLSGCYTLSSYWEDVARAHCLCTEPSRVDACVDEQMDALDEEGLLESCGQEASPASWREMWRWRDDYGAQCDLSEAIPPGSEKALPESCL